MYSPADWSSIWCPSLSFSLCPLSSLQSSIFIHPTYQLLGTSYMPSDAKHPEVTIQNTIASCFWATLLGKAANGFRNVDCMSIKRQIVKMNWFCLVLRKEGSVCFMCHLSAYANLLTLHWLLHNIENLIEMMVHVRAFFVHQ